MHRRATSNIAIALTNHNNHYYYQAPQPEPTYKNDTRLGS